MALDSDAKADSVLRTPARYRLAVRDNEPSVSKNLSYSGDFVLAAMPFIEKNSYSFKSKVTRLGTDRGLETTDPMLLEHHCVAVSVVSSKRSHVSKMTAVLIDADDIFATLAPGDWVMAWMCDNITDANSVRERINAKKQVNEFRDGLKFVGRVNSISRSIAVNPQSGMVDRRVQLDCSGFDELDTAVYYDPALAINDASSLLFMADLQDNMDKFWKADATLDVNSAIPSLLSVFVGAGPGDHSKRPDGSLLRSPNSALRVPNIIGQLLGRVAHSEDKAGLSYADILSLVVGVQEYGEHDAASLSNVSADTRILGLLPRVSNKNALQVFTPKPLTGKFNKQVVPWHNVPVWGILRGFLNDVINEMYTCLRVGVDGKVAPHLIVRQKPFTTHTYAQENPITTTYLSLPRWVVDPVQVLSFDVVRSNALRANFVEVRGQPAAEFFGEAALQRANNPPIFDATDIKRSGLNAYTASVNCVVASITAGTIDEDPNREWSKMVADFIMGGHLKLTGSLVLKGIQEPICEGDNVEFDGLVFHIEQVTHSISISPESGMKDFTTTLTLSEGLLTDGDFVGKKLTSNLKDPTAGFDASILTDGGLT